MPFNDRSDAGRRLARALAAYGGEDVVVLALPRGGLPVAAEVAEALHAPLDLVLARKIGAPQQPELAMGAIAGAGHPVTVRNPDVIALLGVDAQTFAAVEAAEWSELERRRRAYLGDRAPVPVAGRVAIVVDDGVATGATTRAALRAVRAQRPSRLVLATPVAPLEVAKMLRDETDDLVCLEAMGPIGAIGAHYRDFRQLSDEDVAAILARFPVPAAAPSKG
jgi:predicted phosphoribosyltransferase